MRPLAYPKDPIVEALVEVRLGSDAPWSDDLAGKLSQAFRDAYPAEPLTRNQFAFHAKVEGDSFSTGGSLGARQILCRTLDGKALVGLAQGVLSVHVLAPYPGWASFFPRIQHALAAYSQTVPGSYAEQASLRYIDRIPLPNNPNVPLHRLLPILPARPPSMPETLDGFHIVTQVRDEAERLTVVLTVASVAGRGAEAAVLAVLYDLSLTKGLHEPMALTELGQHIEELHRRQRDIFEDSITDDTRELFR